jgi:hypothetical protein
MKAMKYYVVAWILLAVLILAQTAYGVSGCGWYPVCYISPWTTPQCPNCISTRTVEDSGCWGPALPQSNCVATSIPTWAEMLCVGGVCRWNTANYEDFVPAHKYGPDCKYSAT